MTNIFTAIQGINRTGSADCRQVRRPDLPGAPIQGFSYVWLQTRIQTRRAGERVAGDSEAGDSLGGVEIGAGVLELWCIERDGDREWKLEFDVRYNPT